MADQNNPNFRDTSFDEGYAGEDGGDEKIPNSANEELLVWTFLEYDQHEHSKRWWIWFWSLSFCVAAVSVWLKNFLFAVIVLIFDILVFYRHYTPPPEITCTFTERGIKLDEREYLYREIQDFWIADNEVNNVRRLYIRLKRGLRAHISIPVPLELAADDLRTFLSAYIQENPDEEHELLGDSLARILRI